jgi:hypothetical protein
MLKYIIAGSLIAAAPLHAQSNASAAAAPPAQAPTVQPASGGQVARPPQNSAMRQAGEGGATTSAQAGGGSTPTNAMTLTLGRSSGSSMQGPSQRYQTETDNRASAGQGSGDAEGGDAAASQQQGASYDATGVLRPGGNAGGGSQP